VQPGRRPGPGVPLRGTSGPVHPPLRRCRGSRWRPARHDDDRKRRLSSTSFGTTPRVADDQRHIPCGVARPSKSTPLVQEAPTMASIDAAHARAAERLGPSEHTRASRLQYPTARAPNLRTFRPVIRHLAHPNTRCRIRTALQCTKATVRALPRLLLNTSGCAVSKATLRVAARRLVMSSSPSSATSWGSALRFRPILRLLAEARRTKLGPRSDRARGRRPHLASLLGAA
jgi:hypothetical protein